MAADPRPRLTDKIALITGGARGQGASHALRLGQEGAVVYIADVLDDDGEAEAARLRGEGLDVTYLHLDVTDVRGWQEVMDAIGHAHARLDVLVNNAGIIHLAAIEDEDPGAWNKLLNVNLTGAFLGIRAAIPQMRAAGRGSIINISSIFGPSGAIGNAAYAASKAGLLGLTRTAALELATDLIRVTAVCPGGVSTPMNEREKEGGVVPETPLGRRAHVSEISSVIAFLASDDASFITGTEVFVDGGFSAR
jgi:NAD(P)-dependent dehydrogenase (short-subunit alcohol dehydrogenase family)